ncbi:unnamed protein product [Lepeophtheirus salmonis]|uniref:(salmon louse) hypothetical protein n=1 Tax=Lepeophtheirus salmonis TaxID=72036 RepID=A0A7R8CIQ5_LEPSM|nr:unnamed protein product [Lepeophtheirus salmonis]CAF2835600.1 unnamed protein product [Lepeophtheirus salmonis]
MVITYRVVLLFLLLKSTFGGRLLSETESTSLQERPSFVSKFVGSISNTFTKFIHIIGGVVPLRGIASVAADIGIPGALTLQHYLTPSKAMTRNPYYCFVGSSRDVVYPSSLRVTEAVYSKQPVIVKDQHGILDTFSLSFAGNFDFSRSYEGLKKILQGLSEFIDLKLIHSGVNLAFDTMAEDPSENSVYSRIGEPSPEDEVLRRGITTVIGALMNKQECWIKTACIIGDYSRTLKIKEFLIIVAKKIAPPEWKKTMDVFVSASNNETDCRTFLCSPKDRE